MFDSIYWKGYFRVSSPNKVDIMLCKLEKIIGQNIFKGECKQYWKDSSLFEAYFKTSLEVDDIEKAVFKALLISNLVGHDCYVTGPNSFKGGKWQFEGIINKATLPGLEWIHFRLQNF
ncbi:MAG: hypothetical protein Q8936_13370 [Bacillota bacterium]|nr:hypothetical protein [Bacillota bacterium]